MKHPEGNYSNGRAQAEIGALSPDDVRERLWAYEDFAAAQEQQPFNVAGAFASLGFVMAAIRRQAALAMWAGIGLVAGLAIYVKYPVSYQSTVSVLIKNNPGEDPISAMQTQEQLVQSQSVAAATLKSLATRRASAASRTPTPPPR